MAGGGGKAKPLEFTPTWIVALVCSVMIIISLLFERLLHRLGKRLIRSRKKPLYEALLKVKEELMLLGFISLLLTVFQGPMGKLCVSPSAMLHLQPCKPPPHETDHLGGAVFTGVLGGGRRLLAGGASSSDEYCLKKVLHTTPAQLAWDVHDFVCDALLFLLLPSSSIYCFPSLTRSTLLAFGMQDKVPLLSSDAIHQLHIFIFVLAVTHFLLSAITVLLGIAQTRNWRHWETKIQENNDSAPQMIKHVQEFKFIQDHFKGHRKRSRIFGWMRSFFKQFYGSVTEEDYTTMRLGFIMKHCKGTPKFNFYSYMIRALEVDFKKVVGISWYLWAMLMIFLLLNVEGWYVYIWITLVPFIMLLVVGSKMEHIITELAYEVAQKHTAIRGDLVVSPSDNFFWFHRPKLVLLLIHIVLFQNAFEIAFFFWLLVTYGFKSCIMGKPAYVITRVVISVICQVLCGYSTLPLYAVVSHMGNSFKKTIFDDNVTEGLVNWAEKARRGTRTPNKITTDASSSPIDEANGGAVQMTNTRANSSVEQGTARLI
ncbi:MLO-like protein 1 isoform X1 [Triticum aestivum]|uniref:MLO-like protein 1 isoform X1 n=1 Tax=Triticum aestivum TaxID=4565 RepID=UPI001D01190A|nr:MLO-like protein 1 isoform X1 [Triticum aestivum]